MIDFEVAHSVRFRSLNSVLQPLECSRFLADYAMFVVDWIKAILKFFLVDSIVNVLGDLFEQPLLMWAFIGWGWLSIWVMVFSIYDTIGQL